MVTDPGSQDLWPQNLLSPPATAPLDRLREQADLLAKKTSDLIYGRVVSRSMTDVFLPDVEHRDGRVESVRWKQVLLHRFELLVPQVDFRYELLWFIHDPADGYRGVFGGPAFGDICHLVEDSDQFGARLAEGLGSERTQRVIRSLYERAQQESGT